MAGKKYKAAAALIDNSRAYSYQEAVALAKKTNPAKFDASVEACFHLNIDPRQADQNIRGAMVLPNGTGKTRTVLVITQGAKVEEAKAAGADFVGGADMLEQIKGGWFGFDVIVATPDMMGQLGKLGKLLGPKGLMPNPKTGTVTMNVAQALDDVDIKALVAGRIGLRDGLKVHEVRAHGNLEGLAGQRLILGDGGGAGDDEHQRQQACKQLLHRGFLR